jgi:Cft2 family RNA processing exonuclease
MNCKIIYSCVVFCTLRDKGTNGEGVLHTVYADGACGRRWNDIAQMEENFIDIEVHRALETKYGV